MKYIFIINPVAGKGKLQPLIVRQIKSYFESNIDKEYDIYFTKHTGDAENHCRILAESGEQLWIFACGGEGTFYEVLNGTIGFKNISLGVVPCGSANDFLKYFDKNDAFSNIAAQINGSILKTDIIKAGERYCINGCSVGMDAIVARDMSIFKNWPFVNGKTAYNLAVAKTFLKRIGVKINLSIDDSKPFEADCLFAVIANAPFYGGGYMAAPGAIPYDGMLNFTLVDTISKLKVPGFLNKYKKGKIVGLDYCKLLNCKKMKFTADIPIPINLDGEITEASSMEFSIVEKGVNFIVPKNSV